MYDDHPSDEPSAALARTATTKTSYDDDDDEDEDAFGYEEEEPFDCDPSSMLSCYSEVDVAAAVARARRYSPWEDNRGQQQQQRVALQMAASAAQAAADAESAASPSRRTTTRQDDNDDYSSPPSKANSSSSTSSTTMIGTPSPARRSGNTNNGGGGSSSKSRPWRVDVLLKKGSKGVERASSSWKQQMKERKQVFALSGVTVSEEENDDFEMKLQSASSSCDRAEEDELSKGSEKAVIGRFRHTSASPKHPSSSQSPPQVPVVIDLTDVEEPPESSSRSRNYIRSFEDKENSLAVAEVANVLEGALQQDNEEHQRLEEERRRLLLQWKQQLPQDEHLEETTGGRVLFSENDDNVIQQTPSSSSIPFMLGVGRQQDFHVDSDDDDLQSVTSVRSILSSTASYPSSPIRKEQTRIEANRKLLVQSLEAKLSKSLINEDRYTITTMGRAGLDPPRQIRNEYFQVHARFQRSRLLKELYSTITLLPTRHFQVVEATNDLYSVGIAQDESLETLSFGDVKSSFSGEEMMTTAQNDEDEEVLPVEGLSGVPEPEASSSMAEVEGLPEQATAAILDETETTTAATESTIEQVAATRLEPAAASGNMVILEEEKKSDDDEDPLTAEELEAAEASAMAMMGEATVEEDTKTPQEMPSSVPPPPATTIEESGQGEDDEMNGGGKSPGKKSKASKWKDRLAKRKSGVIKRESDVSNASGGSSSNSNNDPPPSASPVATAKSVEPVTTMTPTTPGKPPKAPTSTTTPSVPNLSSPTLDHEELVQAPGVDTPKGKGRKSMLWKQRLANKRGSGKTGGDNTTNSPASLTGKNTKEAASSATSIPEDAKVPSLPSIKATTEATPVAASSSNSATVAQTSGPAPVVVESKPLEVEKPKVQEEKKQQPVPRPVQASSTNKKPAEPATTGGIHKDLRSSFMVFDALLKQRQGGDVDGGDDEYSEYTIEETVLHPAASATKATFQPTANAAKSPDNQSLYEEITVEQSYMEFTVDDTAQDSSCDGDSEEPINPSAPITTPVHPGTSHLMSSRMFSTPRVANEPTITVQPMIDDDDMTQLTFDQSYVEPTPRREAVQPPSPGIKDTILPKSADSLSKVGGTKETQASTTGSMQGSRNKRDSMNSSFPSGQRSNSSKGGVSTGSSSERNTKRISDILRKDIWSRDANVVQQGLETIVAEACRGSKYRTKISQFGGVMGIVRAMESHRDVESVQVSGCSALERMALDAETQVIIGEMGGIATILDAMRTFEASGNVHQAACGALANITRHRGTTDEADGAVSLLCASMTRHSDNMTVQAKAFGAIANLCMDNEVRLKELSDAGGMLAMTMALQQPWPNKTEKHEAISNLSILLRCLAEHEEGGDHEEDGYEEEYPEQNGEDHDEEDMMSAVSELEDPPAQSEAAAEQLQQPLERKKSAESQAAEETLKQIIAQVDPAAKDAKPSTKSVGQGSNSTQPTESTSREGDDENCLVS